MDLQDPAVTLITIGGVFLLGLLIDALGRRTRLPRVTLLIIFGFLLGPDALNLLTETTRKWFPYVSNMALVMIRFLLGGEFTLSALREHGRIVLWVSIAVVLFTAATVFSGLMLAGIPCITAIMLAGIAPATDPAATIDVVREARAKGPFSRILLGIVAIDDAWGLIFFSFSSSR